jgi:hypothetical protein
MAYDVLNVSLGAPSSKQLSTVLLTNISSLFIQVIPTPWRLGFFLIAWAVTWGWACKDGTHRAFLGQPVPT